MNRPTTRWFFAAVALGLVGTGCTQDGSTPTQLTTSTATSQHGIASDFVTIEEDGRLWVFRADSEELGKFRSDGELAKHVIRPKAGPGGVTLKSPDAETLDAYMAQVTSAASMSAANASHGGSIYDKPGFHTELHDGRLWVFKAGSEELEMFQKNGELAKHVIRPKAGPDGMTIKAPDTETIDAYMASW